MKWQPIETAPKDGTSILIAVEARSGDCHVAEAYWIMSNWWEMRKLRFGSGANTPEDEILGWMPLPDPPE